MTQDVRKTAGLCIAVLVAFCIGWTVKPGGPRYGVVARQDGVVLRWDTSTGETELWFHGSHEWRRVPMASAPSSSS